jgi:hypothetical protein
VEVGLREHAWTGWTQRPRFRDHLPATSSHLVHHVAVYVRAVDVDLVDREPLTRDVVRECTGAFLLGSVGGRRRDGEDHGQIEVARNVLFVAVEALRTALPSVSHGGVFDGDLPVLSDGLLEGDPAVRRLDEVLIDDNYSGRSGDN